MNILITGVAKGIGLALTRRSLEEGHQVYGVARHPEKSPELLKLKEKFSALHLIALDLTDEKVSEKLTQALKDVTSLDLVINNAGIYQNGTTKLDFLKSFEVNTYVPFIVAQTLLEKLKQATQPKLVHISSMMGSVTDNTSGGAYAYRASKSALNMIHKSLTIDHAWLTSVAMHPGWVQTDMGGSNAPVSTLESANGIWKVINEVSLKDSGCFKTFEGIDLPW